MLQAQNKDLIEPSEENKQNHEKIELITYPAAIKKVFKEAGQFALSRVSVSINMFGNAIVLARLGNVEAAAGPYITTAMFAVIGTARNMVLSTGMIVGELYGEKKFSEIGDAVRRGWLLGAILSIPVLAIHLNVKNILGLSGIPLPVAEAAQEYFTALSFSLPAMFWAPTDMQFALGVKRPRIPLIAGTTYSALGMFIGTLLALNGFGVKGLGYGLSASVWLTLLGLRTYFLIDKSFRPYELFRLRLKGNWQDLHKILRRSSALGFQNLSEWGNLLSISIMGGRLGKAVALTQEISLQPISAYNITLQGLAQGIGVGVANYLGATRYYLNQGDPAKAEICRKNAKRYGNTGIIMGASLSVIVGAIFVALARQLINVLADNSNANNIIDYQTVFYFLLINSLGLITDSIRNINTSILIGNNDVWFPILLSLLMMSVIAAPIGGVVSLFLKQNPAWLYITRDIGITLAALGISTRWLMSDDTEKLPLIMPVEENKPAEEVYGSLTSNESGNAKKDRKNTPWNSVMALFGSRHSNYQRINEETQDFKPSKNKCVII